MVVTLLSILQEPRNICTVASNLNVLLGYHDICTYISHGQEIVIDGGYTAVNPSRA